MKIKIIEGRCMALEAAEVIGRKINGEDYQQTRNKFLMRYGNRFDEEAREKFQKKMDVIEKIYEEVFDCIPEDEETKFLFRKYYYNTTYSSLAQILLINFQNVTACGVSEYLEECRSRCGSTLDAKLHLKEVAFSALVLVPGEVPLRECLLDDVDRLDYPYEFKWNLVRVLLNFDVYIEKLGHILGRIEEKMSEALKPAEPFAEEMKQFWQSRISGNTLEELAVSMNMPVENVTGKTVLLQILRMPCDQAVLEDKWSEEELPLCLGMCVEWGSGFEYEELDRGLLCEELRVFGEESKFEILQLLKDEGSYGKEIAKRMELDAATVSRHLSVLQRYGLIYVERRDGRNIYYRTNQGEIRNLLELLQKIFISKMN